MNTRRRWPLGGVAATAIVLLLASAAWACTGVTVPEPVYPLSLQRPFSTASPDTMTVTGVYPRVPGFTGTVDVYQHPGHFVLSTSEPVRVTRPGSCNAFSFWKVGTITWSGGQQGTGTATFAAAQDASGDPIPGVYEVCAFPEGERMRGYWTFL